MTWREEAACRGIDTERYFTSGRPSARLVCRCLGCKVRAECLVSALAEETCLTFRYGVRGGLTPLQRETLARAVPAPSVRRLVERAVEPEAVARLIDHLAEA